MKPNFEAMSIKELKAYILSIEMMQKRLVWLSKKSLQVPTLSDTQPKMPIAFPKSMQSIKNVEKRLREVRKTNRESPFSF
jgi:hypothetical protein